jgi:hypothetical protein
MPMSRLRERHLSLSLSLSDNAKCTFPKPCATHVEPRPMLNNVSHSFDKQNWRVDASYS